MHLYLADLPKLRRHIELLSRAPRAAKALLPEGAYPLLSKEAIDELPEAAIPESGRHLILIDWDLEDSDTHGPAWAFLMECGRQRTGEGAVFCGPDLKRMQRQYPYGWRNYPGDVCPHGRYVGGSGIDWMCGRCEMGEE